MGGCGKDCNGYSELHLSVRTLHYSNMGVSRNFIKGEILYGEAQFEIGGTGTSEGPEKKLVLLSVNILMFYDM